MDVLCKFSEITVPAHENVQLWSHVIGASVRGMSPEPWVHKPRQRSSSAQSRASSPNLRPREASVSPPRSQSECTDVLIAEPNAAIWEKELWASYAGKSNTYFSRHPPSEPIQVLIFGAPPTLPIAHTVARQDLKAVWPSLEPESVEKVWLTPRMMLGGRTAPCARLPRPSCAHVRWCCQKEEGAGTERHEARGSRRAVRRLLRDLIAALPLLARGEQQEKYLLVRERNGTEAGAEVAPSVDASISVQAAPAPPPPASRSVAVQAQSLTSCVDKGIMGSQCQLQTKNTSSGGADEKRACAPEAWVGGARALRDSHVRLVLRQLRHIERLNRALDHAVPALKHKQ